MRQWLERLGVGATAGTLRRAAGGSLLLQLALTGLALLTNILLARWLGVSEYGIYSLAVTWLGLLFLPAQLGLDRLLVREAAVYEARADWSRLQGILRFSFATVLPFAILLGLAVLAAARLWPEAGAFPQFAVLALFMLQLPFAALTRLAGSGLRGLNHVLRGQVPGSLASPLLLLLLVLGAMFLVETPPTAVNAAGLTALRTAVACLLALVLLWQAVPAAAKTAAPTYDARLWAAAALPLLLTNVAGSLSGRIDALMLGALSGPEAVGIYNAAFRGVQLILFGLLAVNMAIEPALARLYAGRDLAALQRLMTRSARAVLLYTVPAAILFVLLGPWYLALFGPEFAAGYGALVILSLGRVFGAAMGSAGLLLAMSGHERDFLAATFAGAGLNLLLDWLLIPRLGLNGAAWASVAGLVAMNGLAALRAWQLLGIGSTAVGPRHRS